MWTSPVQVRLAATMMGAVCQQPMIQSLNQLSPLIRSSRRCMTKWPMRLQDPSILFSMLFIIYQPPYYVGYHSSILFMFLSVLI